MIHIREYVSEDVAVAVCGAPPNDEDEFVDAALQSDCDVCRTNPRINVGRVGDVRWDGRGRLGVSKSVAAYEPHPWEHVKTREEERGERTKTAAQHNAEAGSTVGAYNFTPNEKFDNSSNRRRKKR